MIIIGVLLVLVIAGIWYECSGSSLGDGEVFALFFGILLLIALTIIPISRMSTRASIQEFEAVRATFISARNLNRGLENAAIQLKVAESNSWLASTKYYNNTVFDLWIPDDVEKLQPIQ